jgi:molecular chaperone HtpG
MSERIVFEVETTRVLRILASEIYDSPLALLRENLQNAYDAVRMRFVRDGVLTDGGRIDIRVGGGEVSISDNGVGMTEDVLSSNFWKAGSSGKQSDAARQAGVVGTFGIGAMANFGVCRRLTVETRAEGGSEVLRSVADRDSLKISEKCISLDRLAEGRDVGTTVTGVLDAEHSVGVEEAKRYLGPFASLLPVPVYLNDEMISRGTLESRLPIRGRDFALLGSLNLSDSLCGGTFEVRADANGQILVHGREITLAGNPVEGYLALLQGGGQLMGLRSHFGLAPIPAVGYYQFGGIANLAFLQPTAGREAVSRESIEQVSHLTALAERAASELLSATSGADTNNALLQWLQAHGRYDLARKVTIHVLPDEKEVELGQLKAHIGSRKAHYYIGRDAQILLTFANENLCLVQVAQANPRRNVQLHWVQNELKLEQVPDAAQVTRVYTASELTVPEASVLVKTISILRDDYLIGDAEVVLADISHGVTVLPEKTGECLRIHVAKHSSLLPPLLEFYDRAYDVFSQFMKDFVRVYVYPRIQQFVPSSTRDGVDALRKILMRNRELYRYDEAERGDLEGVLGEYLSGVVNLAEVMRVARVKVRAQSQRVYREQVGTVEAVVPDVVESPVQQEVGQAGEFGPNPPIIRDEVSSDKKILTTDTRYPQLNNFTMLLGLSDRLMRTESDFFRAPHTTRILWAGHRVMYIFTETTGRLSLYYDIQLHEAIESTKVSGGMFPTTTLITKRRIFVPVPDALAEEFRVSSGSKEFFVRFDVLSSDPA